MPPGLRLIGDRGVSRRVTKPHLPAFTGDGATLIGLARARNRRRACSLRLSYKMVGIARYPSAKRSQLKANRSGKTRLHVFILTMIESALAFKRHSIVRGATP